MIYFIFKNKKTYVKLILLALRFKKFFILNTGSKRQLTKKNVDMPKNEIIEHS